MMAGQNTCNAHFFGLRRGVVVLLCQANGGCSSAKCVSLAGTWRYQAFLSTAAGTSVFQIAVYLSSVGSLKLSSCQSEYDNRHSKFDTFEVSE